MNKEFIPYEHALDLIELGFNEPCLGWYQEQTLILDINANQSIKFHKHLGRFKDCFLAPTFSQTFRWFREKHNLHCEIKMTCVFDINRQYYWDIKEINSPNVINNPSTNHDTYEDAQLEGFIKLIQIVKI